MAIFKVHLDQLVVPARKPLETAGAVFYKYSTSWMLFMTCNQQHQTTKGSNIMQWK